MEREIVGTRERDETEHDDETGINDEKIRI